MVKHLLVVLFAALLLSACTAAFWDPTADIGSGEGHVTGRKAEARAAPEEGLNESVLTFGDVNAEGTPPERKRRYAGTGTFVKRVEAKEKPVAPGDITLNFDNTDIREVVKVILGDLLELNYILDPAVNGSVTMETARPLSRELLLPTLETLLRMNKAALVHSEGVYRVVPLGTAIQGTVLPQLGETALPLPTGYSVRVVPLQYIAATEMSQILQPLAPEGSVIRVDTVRNLLILAGTSPELGKLLETVEIFDVDWIKGLSVGLFRLEYAKLSDVSQQLNALLGAGENNPLAGLFRIIPLESANSLLIITPQERYLDEISGWIDRLDQPGGEGDGVERLYVYRVKHGDAENLASMLSQLFAGKSTTGTAARVAPGLTAAQIGTTATQAKGEGVKTPTTTKSGATATGFNLESGVSIVADVVNNSLLIRSTPGEYRKIADALEKLDILPLQVLVEATIIEISLVGNLEYGLQWFFETDHGNHKSIWTGGADFLNSAEANPVTGASFPGFNWQFVNDMNNIRAFFKALASDNLINVLSSPSLMVLANQTASIEVGDQVPRATSRSTATTSDNAPVLSSFEYTQTGVILNVTPKVTPGGLVIMEVDQAVKREVDPDARTDTPTIQNRSIKSVVAVKHNQAVVLGGLIEDQAVRGDAGVPGLYKLPFLGWAFGNTTRSATRRELVVVLTPRVIANDQDIESVNRDFKRRLKGLHGKF